MAKNSKKNRNRALKNVAGAAVLVVPAALAAATAFMNTLVAKDNGTIDALMGDGRKKGRKKKTSDSSQNA